MVLRIYYFFFVVALIGVVRSSTIDCTEYDSIGMYYGENSGGSNWYPDSSITLPNCKSAAIMPRGVYSANLAPCVFSFYKFNDSSVSDGGDGFHLSTTACSIDNGLPLEGSNDLPGTVEQYVDNWSDECVANLARCYSLKRNEAFFERVVCGFKWELPVGTTHMSVDCTDDKELKEQRIDTNTGDLQPFLDQGTQRIHEIEEVVFAIIALLLVSWAICCWIGYRFLFRPYLDTMRMTRPSRHRYERDGLMMSKLDNDGNGQDATETTEDGSVNPLA